MADEALENLLTESRSFPPPPDLAANANATADFYKAADADRLDFWAEPAAHLGAEFLLFTRVGQIHGSTSGRAL